MKATKWIMLAGLLYAAGLQPADAWKSVRATQNQRDRVEQLRANDEEPEDRGASAQIRQAPWKKSPQIRWVSEKDQD